MKENENGATRVTFRIDESVLQEFRMAVSKKHKGVIRGTTFIEINEALKAWTKVMNGQAKITPINAPPSSAIFGEKKKER